MLSKSIRTSVKKIIDKLDGVDSNEKVDKEDFFIFLIVAAIMVALAINGTPIM